MLDVFSVTPTHIITNFLIALVTADKKYSYSISMHYLFLSAYYTTVTESDSLP